MDRGNYRGRRVNFNDYAASFFHPYIFAEPVRARMGCGISSLALLTGAVPEDFAQHKRSSNCSDAFMVRFLRKKGFRTLRLTQCNLSQSDKAINDRHVVLLSALIRPNEGTWLVLFRGCCYHNFDLYSLEQLSFLNKPILTAHLVVHPSWQLPRDLQQQPARKIEAPKEVLTMSKLGWAGLGS